MTPAVTAWTDDAATVREALGTAGSWTTREDVRYEERDKGLAALARLTALLETQEQRLVNQIEWTEVALTALRTAHDTERRTHHGSCRIYYAEGTCTCGALDTETTRLREGLQTALRELERASDVQGNRTGIIRNTALILRALLAGDTE